MGAQRRSQMGDRCQAEERTGREGLGGGRHHPTHHCTLKGKFWPQEKQARVRGKPRPPQRISTHRWGWMAHGCLRLATWSVGGRHDTGVDGQLSDGWTLMCVALPLPPSPPQAPGTPAASPAAAWRCWPPPPRHQPPGPAWAGAGGDHRCRAWRGRRCPTGELPACPSGECPSPT